MQQADRERERYSAEIVQLGLFVDMRNVPLFETLSQLHPFCSSVTLVLHFHLNIRPGLPSS